MRKFALLLVSTIGLTVAASAAMADAAAPAPAPVAAAPVSELDKTVCRVMMPATGTRLGARRECRTQREWDDIRRQNEKEVSKMETRDNLSPQGH